VFGFFLTMPAWPQSTPIYQVNVVERSVRAVNYQYHGGPVPIDFAGTVLLPYAKGEAVVEAKDGRTSVDAHLEGLQAPSQFGPEYLTYVLWAVTPEGRAKNLGEVVAGPSNKAHLQVTTELSNFGMLVTAEPYATVREPSDVVVMENRLRSDTSYSVESIEVKYGLMPRGTYTYQVPPNGKAPEPAGPLVSMNQYQAITAVYQARNAVQIAESKGAAEYAPDVFAKAQQQYQSAADLQANKGDWKLVVTAAHQAAQTAEDARVLAEKSKQEAELNEAKKQADAEQQMRLETQARLDQETAARQRAEAQAEANSRAAAAQPAPAPQVETPVPSPVTPTESVIVQRASDASEQRKLELRISLMGQLRGPFEIRDTPRGLVQVVPASDLRPGAAGMFSRLAAALAANPGLRVEVDGYSDASGEEAEAACYQHARMVRDLLVSAGVAASVISVRPLGNSEPLASNATAAGREKNRRVEVVISGDPIGTLASWDKSYDLTAPR
jgi:outer membrane protein OmpA-like peptidoglycan-associated protein